MMSNNINIGFREDVEIPPTPSISITKYTELASISTSTSGGTSPYARIGSSNSAWSNHVLNENLFVEVTSISGGSSASNSNRSLTWRQSGNYIYCYSDYPSQNWMLPTSVNIYTIDMI